MSAENSQKSNIVDMSQHIYAREIDLNDENNSLVKVYNYIEPNTKVLDVGCTDGLLGRYLKKNKSCHVTGVDFNKDAIALAKKVLDRAEVLDVCSQDAFKDFKNENYDYIIFADVLEHLADPLPVLIEAKKLLSPTGNIIISVPNVAHGSIRLSILNGQFDYTEEGLLDRTHLRFFTYKSLMKFAGNAGLFPVEVERTYSGVSDYNRSVGETIAFDENAVNEIECLPEATTLQFVVHLIPLKGEKHRELLNARIRNLECLSLIHI